MSLAQWIITGLVIGGLGVTVVASKYGWSLKSTSDKHRSGRVGSTRNHGKYYHGGKY
jgi:hypothetical protein